ncbi:unnamed protein product, partial [Pylaiella littoralis]
MFCLECGKDKALQCFTQDMLVNQCGYLQCTTCVDSGAPKPWVSSTRPCLSCDQLKHKNMFSQKQLKSASGSTCLQCMGKATCGTCLQQRPLESFSRSQLGRGQSRR